jgi:hypothetical protein
MTKTYPQELNNQNKKSTKLLTNNLMEQISKNNVEFDGRVLSCSWQNSKTSYDTNLEIKRKNPNSNPDLSVYNSYSQTFFPVTQIHQIGIHQFVLIAIPPKFQSYEPDFFSAP